MFIYLVAFVVILCSIFGLSYSRPSLRLIQNGGANLSTIRLPIFMHRTPLMQHPQAGFDGDGGIATQSSQQSLEISNEGMEETNGGQGVVGGLRDDRYQFERKIIDQKIRDANQIGLMTESVWPNGAQKVIKNALNNNLNSLEAAKPVHQKINTNTIFNMIQYETFKEAMAVLKQQQELEEAARIAAANFHHDKFAKSGTQDASNDKEKDNFRLQDSKR